MRVLVTGASGFLGQSVLAELAVRGQEVISVSRRERNATGAEQSRVLASPEDSSEVRELLSQVAPQIVVHLAGVSSAANYTGLYRANVVFAANLLDAALAMPSPPRVLVTGSAAEYGPVPDSVHSVPEDHLCRPNTAYGISKLAQTGHALAASARGLSVVVARLFNPIGAGMPNSLALGSFAQQIAALGPTGGVLTTGDLDVERDFIDVAEAARLLVELALGDRGTGEIVNVCTGLAHSLLEVTRRLTQLAGVPVELRQDVSRRGNSDVRRFVGDPLRLRALGLEPKPVVMDAVLEKILRHARRQPTGD